MPLPTFLLPALFAAGSTALNYSGAKKQDRALAGAQAAERIRQDRLDEEAFALNQRSQDRYEDAPEQAETRSGELADLFRGAVEAPAAQPSVGMPQSSSNVVNNAVAKAAAGTAQRSSDRADQMGNLRGFADFFGDTQRNNARDFGELGLLGGFKRGSAGVLPAELDAASQKGGGLRTLGDLFNLGAGLSLQGALAGKSGTIVN